MTEQATTQQVVVEATQAVHVDGTVVRPHALEQAGGPRGAFTEEYQLVRQVERGVRVEDVVHLDHRLSSRTAAELAWRATSSIQSSVVVFATSVNASVNAAMYR